MIPVEAEVRLIVALPMLTSEIVLPVGTTGYVNFHVVGHPLFHYGVRFEYADEAYNCFVNQNEIEAV